MEVTVKGGFSFPCANDTWIKCDIDIKLNEKEIANPTAMKVHERIDKGIKLITVALEKHLSKQVEDIRSLAENEKKRT